MSRFGAVTPRIVEELASGLGWDNVLTDPESIARHSHDETEDLEFPPEVVVRPASTEEVSHVLKTATRHRVPVTPRGGGTGLSGVEKQGFYYPPDPASRGSCTIGGNVAENAGGPHAVKYGVTGDWVSGLEAVLPDGTVFATGGKLRKVISGYNLTPLLVGSEGTLAVVTRIILKLIPLPAHRRAMVACFDTVEAAARTVVAVFGRKVIPAAVELMEGDAWRTGCEKLGKRPVSIDHAAYLLLEVDGRVESVVEDEAILLGEAVKRIAPYKEEDTVVPRRQVPELIAAVHRILGEHGLRAVCYGHAGDGNIHVNILRTGKAADAWAGADGAIREIFSAVGSLGGKISGEHGIGWVQKDYMTIVHSEPELELMRGIKRLFDPAGILNPGKMFPDRPFIGAEHGSDSGMD